MSVQKNGVPDRVAYGQKSGIDLAIKNGLIPKGGFIVAKTGVAGPELMFHDTGGEVQVLTTASIFSSTYDLASYLEENGLLDYGEVQTAGRFISVQEEGDYIPYLLQKDGKKTPLTVAAYITSVKDEFEVTDGTLSLNKISLDSVSGLVDALKKLEQGESLGDDFPSVSYIEMLKLNGVALPFNTKDNSVDIPLATAKTLGLVKHSENVNEVSIGDEGIMTLTSLSLDRLVDSQEGLVVFSCGDSL